MQAFLKRLFRFSLIGLVPTLIAGSIYIYFDPFKVLRDYDTFMVADTNGMVNLNRDFVSTTLFNSNNKKYNYNSFIFGNSRSLFYLVADWKPHLNENASCFHYDASGESLWAINKKIEYIDKQGNMIENVLLILDYPTLIQDVGREGHLSVISPALVNNSNLIEFHRTFFLAFLTPKFLYAYLDFKFSGKIKPYMKKGALLDDSPRNHDVSTNELRFDYYENLIVKGEYYTPKRMKPFYDRDTLVQQFSPACILENQKSILSNIKSIVNKHNTNLKVIISPLYDQKKLNNEDIKFLNQVFGEKNVFDFSGISKTTNDYRNYYENSHYRPHVTREMLKTVYAQ
jgi:hypothetical protein